mgnify:CR=1 FL=1
MILYLTSTGLENAIAAEEFKRLAIKSDINKTLFLVVSAQY